MVGAQGDALVHLLMPKGIVKVCLGISMVICQQGRGSTVAADTCSVHG